MKTLLNKNQWVLVLCKSTPPRPQDKSSPPLKQSPVLGQWELREILSHFSSLFPPTGRRFGFSSERHCRYLVFGGGGGLDFSSRHLPCFPSAANTPVPNEGKKQINKSCYKSRHVLQRFGGDIKPQLPVYSQRRRCWKPSDEL